MKRILLITALLCASCSAQIMQQVLGSTPNLPGPFNFTVIDHSSCTNGSAPSTGQLGSSTFPSLPSGASFTVTNANTDVTCSTAQTYLWPTFTLTGGAWPNTSAYSIKLATGTAGDGISFTYPSSTVQGTLSSCLPIYTDWPQNGGLTTRVDLWDLDTNGSPSTFLNGQLQGTASTLEMFSECSPSGGTCPGGEGDNGVYASNSWRIMCHITTVGGTGSHYQAQWNTPQNGGGLVANSLVSVTGSFTTGKIQNQNFQLGTNGGLSGHGIYGSTEVSCGVTTGQTPCGFPVVPGLQLIAPTLSPGGGNYTSAQTVAITNVSSQTDSYYYTTCSSAGCTPTTPTTGSTLYSGTITATPPEAVSAISVRAAPYNNPASAVTTANYVAPNAIFVNSAKANIASGTSNPVTGLSIPSTDLIVVGLATSSGGGTLSVADSNSDSPSCGTTVTQANNGNKIRLCLIKPGATITSVTCSTTSSNAQECVVAWYTPGTLTIALDQSTGQDQPNTQLWTSGTTSTLSGSSDLVIDFWGIQSAARTSTYSDGSTQRIGCGTQVGCGLSDRTGWGTPGASASGSWDTTTFGAAAVIAIK